MANLLPFVFRAKRFGFRTPSRFFLLFAGLVFNGLAMAQVDTWHDPLPQKQKLQTVVIDAGHGGYDSGCLGASSQEKYLALAIARKLRDSLQAAWPDLRIIMTREDDTFVPLSERARIANENKADLFISIHCNFMPGMTATRGTETYVLGAHKLQENLEVAMRENSSILLEDNYEEVYDFDPNSPEGYIIMSMYQNAFLEQSIQFATYVEESLKQHAGRRSRGVKQAGFLVLRATAMPSVLIETGFLSYRPEEEYLRSEAGQAQVAGAIFRAFAKYKQALQGTPEVERIPPVVEFDMPQKAISTSSAPEKKEEEALVDASASSSPDTLVRKVAVASSPAEPRLVSEEASEAEIHFRVQLLASPREEDLGAARWQNTGYLIQVILEKGLYKYQAVSFPDINAARAACSELRAKGFPDAFVVAYRGAERISLAEALK